MPNPIVGFAFQPQASYATGESKPQFVQTPSNPSFSLFIHILASVHFKLSQTLATGLEFSVEFQSLELRAKV
jgi:hypothetical protein